MITDSGAELLMLAIHHTARQDLEAQYAWTLQHRTACHKGQLDKFLLNNQKPLDDIDEASVIWWFKDLKRAPNWIKDAVDTVEQHSQYCRNCGEVRKVG